MNGQGCLGTSFLRIIAGSGFSLFWAPFPAVTENQKLSKIEKVEAAKQNKKFCPDGELCSHFLADEKRKRKIENENENDNDNDNENDNDNDNENESNDNEQKLDQKYVFSDVRTTCGCLHVHDKKILKLLTEGINK